MVLQKIYIYRERDVGMSGMFCGSVAANDSKAELLQMFLFHMSAHSTSVQFIPLGIMVKNAKQSTAALISFIKSAYADVLNAQ